MEDNAKMIESLLEKEIDYGKTSYELGKLKALDKTSDVVSLFMPHSVVFFLVASFGQFIFQHFLRNKELNYKKP